MRSAANASLVASLHCMPRFFCRRATMRSFAFSTWRTADVLSLDPPLPIVRNPRLSRLQIANQLVQLRLVLCLVRVPPPAPLSRLETSPRHNRRYRRRRTCALADLAAADPAAELETFLLQVMPIEQHRLVGERQPARVAVKKLRIQRAPSAISSRELSGPRASAARQRAGAGGRRFRSRSGTESRVPSRSVPCAVPESAPSCWLAREHFIDREEDLIRLQLWSEVTQVLDWRLVVSARRAASTRSQSAHDTPSGGRTCSCASAASTAAFSSAGHPARRRGCACGHKRQVQAREVVAWSPTRRPRPVRLAG